MSGRSTSVAAGVAQRSVRNLLKTPPLLVAPIIVPLFFFAAFTGALSVLGETEGFDYYDFSAFVFVFVLHMSAMIVGVFTAFDVAADYQSGLGSRFMLAAPRRAAIVAGYVMVSVSRGVLAVVVVWAVAVATGMPVRGGPEDIAALVALALLLNLAAFLFGAGVALRFQSSSADTLILIPVFMVLFMTPVFVPRDELTEWLQTVAGVNPLTAPIEAGRGFLANDPVSVALAFAAAAGLVALFLVWALLGMRSAGEKA
jgi:ABC-2 type transport system permease protein